MNKYAVTLRFAGFDPGEINEEEIFVETPHELTTVSTIDGEAIRLGDTRIVFPNASIGEVEKEL